MQEHWTKKHKRKKEVQRAVLYSLKSLKKPKFPVRITFTRIAPRTLDLDNLVSSMKSVLDAACSWLTPGLAAGRADGVEGLEFCWRQKKGKPKEYGLEIQFEEL